jgi:hypothetical protein
MLRQNKKHRAMKPLPVVLSGLLLLAAIGCSTPDSRAKKNEAAVSSWPAAVQQNVREGKIDVGYTQDMVRVALGDPDRLSSRTTSSGTADVWIYFDKGPKFSIGLGLGSSRRGTSLGGGVNIGDDWRDEEVLRVVFEHGVVSAIERRK